MQHQQYNIAVVSDSQERSDTIVNIFKGTPNKSHALEFYEALHNGLLELPFDAVIVDCLSNLKSSNTIISKVRSQSKLQNIPFIFLLQSDQNILRLQLYKYHNNFIHQEPVDKYTLVSTLNNALHISDLQRKNLLYKDIVEGERKLISNLDELLELDSVRQFHDEKQLLHHLEVSFIKRLELALAVETALFTSYSKNRDVLTLNRFDEQGKKLIRKYTFSLQNSEIKKLVDENYSQIFESNSTQDPFIQELEESLDIKIFSLLFIPITVFHQPRSGIVLINKLYRDSFTEIDLSFSMLAAQKITYHLEKIQLTDFSEGKSASDILISIENKAIHTERNLLKNIMESVNFGAIVFDDQFKIQFINPAVISILKLGKKETEITSLNEVFESKPFDYISEVISQGSFPVIRKELHLHDTDRIYSNLGFSIYSLPSAKKQKQYIMVFSEISNTKRIEAEVIRMDRMASLGALSSGIAHEIRNPLAGIKAMVQTLEEELTNDEQKLEYTQRILRQVKRLERLLKSFFSYAKPMRPDPEQIHVKQIIEEVRPLIDRKLLEKKINFKEEYEPQLSKIFVDSNQIQQVLLNLFLNAFDAMPAGGEMEVKASNALNNRPIVDRRKGQPKLLSDSYIQIIVKDTGIGISEKECNKIFDPFYTTKATGTGLGLSIVYQIIKEHGGWIEVHSEEGKGTEFSILLPIFQEKSKGLDVKN